MHVRFKVYNTCAFIADTYFYKSLNPLSFPLTFLCPLSSLGKYIFKKMTCEYSHHFFQAHLIICKDFYNIFCFINSTNHVMDLILYTHKWCLIITSINRNGTKTNSTATVKTNIPFRKVSPQASLSMGGMSQKKWLMRLEPQKGREKIWPVWPMWIGIPLIQEPTTSWMHTL